MEVNNRILYEAKHSFRPIRREKPAVPKNGVRLCPISPVSISNKSIDLTPKSTPTSPFPARVDLSAKVAQSNSGKNCNAGSDVPNKINPVCKITLEKCSSDPNVFKSLNSDELGENEEKGGENANTCQNSKSADPIMAGISNSFENRCNDLFLEFDKGDLFEVLSKDFHSDWWVVKSCKSKAVGFVPAESLQVTENNAIIDNYSWETEETNQSALSDLRVRVAECESPVFSAMIPKSDDLGSELDQRNQWNSPPNPPQPPFDSQGLILPRKPLNPCIESKDHKQLHRELMFNQRMGKNVLHHKSELQKALEKHKEQVVKRELEQQKLENKSALEKVIEERAKRLENMEKEQEDESLHLNAETEFLKVHAKVRARMDSK